MNLEIILHNWRCFENQKFSLPAESLVICDSNGRGKTSLISAVYSLYLKKPFPQTRLKEAITLDANYFGILTNVADFSLSGVVQNDRLKLQHNLPTKPIDFNNPLKIGKLPKILTYLPLDNYWFWQSRSSKLEILDTLLGQVFDTYDDLVADLAKYVKIKNRFIQDLNKSLTHFDQILLDQLNSNILDLSKQIWEFRQEFFQFLEQKLTQFDTWLAKPVQVQINWLTTDELGNHRPFEENSWQDIDWQKLWQKELLVGKNLFGATRDELDLAYNQNSVAQILSKGEMRLLVLFIKKVTLELTKQKHKLPIWWFLDDVFNEFDLEKESLVWQELIQSADYYLATSSQKKDFQVVSLADLVV
jgi:recombinational DNA repair ATPase RecF